MPKYLYKTLRLSVENIIGFEENQIRFEYLTFDESVLIMSGIEMAKIGS